MIGLGSRAAALQALACAVLIATGCSAPGTRVIDGSTQQSFERSLDELRSGLAADERLRFEAALTLIEAEEVMRSPEPAAQQRALRRRIDGMSADDVVAEAAEVKRSLGDAAVEGVFDLKRKLGHLPEREAAGGRENGRASEGEAPRGEVRGAGDAGAGTVEGPVDGAAVTP